MWVLDTSYDAETIQNVNSEGEDGRKEEPGAEATYDSTVFIMNKSF